MEEAPGPKNHAATAAAAGAAMTTHSDAGAAAGEVMSEVHLGCPPRHPSLYVSRFTFRRPTPGKDNVAISPIDEIICSHQIPRIDADGDLIVTRWSKTSNIGVTIQHKITSSIPSVGLQVWKAALVLSDFVLHTIYTSQEFQNVIALELGAGTGLVGILLSQVAKTVYVTDCGKEVLDNCLANVELNSEVFGCSGTSIYVRELDWIKSWPPPLVGSNSFNTERFFWKSPEIQEAERATFIFAADVVYYDDLTEAFFHTLKNLMSRGSEKVLYLALEKRYNFTLEELDVVATGYSYFRNYIKDEEDILKDGNPVAGIYTYCAFRFATPVTTNTS